MSRSPLLVLPAVAWLAACNTPPSPAVVTIAPAEPDTTHDLTVEFVQVSVDENERDTVAYSFLWSVDGIVRDDLTGQSVPADQTRRDQLWSVQVIPSDGKSAGAPSEAAVTIGNAPPSADVTLLPDKPLSTDDLSVQALGVDPDGDVVTLDYAWTVDGKNAGINGTTVSADRTRRGQTWEVSVTAKDARAIGEPVKASAVIENMEPELHSVELLPQPLYTDSVVEVDVDATDNDGDDLTYRYRWSVNGVEVPDAEDEPSLDPKYFERGEFVQVEVTADDGMSRSRPMQSRSVDVANSLPASAAPPSIRPWPPPRTC